MATTKGEAAVAAVSSPLYVTSDENNGGGLSGTRTTKSFVVPKKDSLSFARAVSSCCCRRRRPNSSSSISSPSVSNGASVAVIVAAALFLVVPGNAVTIFFFFKDRTIDIAPIDNATVAEEDEGSVDASYSGKCHEQMSEFSDLLPWISFWLEGVGIAAVGAFGLCGNILALFVLRSTATANRNFNRLLMCLAVVDSLLLVNLVGETAVMNTFMDGYSPLWYRVAFPYLIHPYKGFVQTCAIYMVVAVSAERYKAVCHPLSHRHGAFKFVLVVVLLSAGLETPRFFQFRLTTRDNRTDYWTTPLMEDPAYIQFSSYWEDICTTGAFPLLLLIFFNLRMILRIRASTSAKFSANRFVGRRESVAPPSGAVRVPSTKKNRKKSSLLFSRKSSDYKDKNIDKNHLAVMSSSTCNTRRESNATVIIEQPLQQPITPTRGETSFSVKSADERKNSDSIQVLKASSKDSTSPVSRLACRINSRFSMSPTAAAAGADHFQKKREKSTLILVFIVLFFVACHSFLLALRVYELAKPDSNTEEHYLRCARQRRFHIPVVFFILVKIHHLFLALNSSINFIIYCAVGKEFRTRLFTLFGKNRRRRYYANTTHSNVM